MTWSWFLVGVVLACAAYGVANIYWQRTKRRADQEANRPWRPWTPGDYPVVRWVSPDGDERVYAVRRSDSFFTCGSDHFNKGDNWEPGHWRPYDTGGSLFDSLETAISEIRAKYSWVREGSPEYAREDGAFDDADTNE